MGALRISGLVLFFVAYANCQSQDCYQCDSAIAFDDCVQKKVTCGPSEECFLEKVTNDQLDAVFNAGCRSATVCNVMAMLGQAPGKRKRELVNCAQCCTNQAGDPEPCNANLCGQKPTKAKPVTCRACNDPAVSSRTACSKTAVCQDTEICSTQIHVEGQAIKYRFGCMERHKCIEFVKHGIDPVGNGKRASTPGVEICSACCFGDDCNNIDCFELRKNMTIAALGTNPPVTAATVTGSG